MHGIRIAEGCYSEYHIDKIFSTKEAAEEYCALQNANSFWKSAEKNSVKVTVKENGSIRVAAILDYDMPEEKVKKIIYDEIARYKVTANEDTYKEEVECLN